MSIPGQSAPPGTDSLTAFREAFPRWHAWLDNGNHLNATRVHRPSEMAAAALGFRARYSGSGVTLDAGSLPELEGKVRGWESEWTAALDRAGVAA